MTFCRDQIRGLAASRMLAGYAYEPHQFEFILDTCSVFNCLFNVQTKHVILPVRSASATAWPCSLPALTAAHLAGAERHGFEVLP
jgi:hypothetical protein